MKQNEWNCTDEHTKALKKLKDSYIMLGTLKHTNKNIILTDISTKSWKLKKPIGFPSRFLSDREAKYAIDEPNYWQ